MSKCKAVSRFAQPGQRHKWSAIKGAGKFLFRDCLNGCGEWQEGTEIPCECSSSVQTGKQAWCASMTNPYEYPDEPDAEPKTCPILECGAVVTDCEIIDARTVEELHARHAGKQRWQSKVKPCKRYG